MSEKGFLVIDGVTYVQVDGYFSRDMKTKHSFPVSSSSIFCVKHVLEPNLLQEPRSYYRKVSLNTQPGTTFHAVLTSTNDVKKIRVDSNKEN